MPGEIILQSKQGQNHSLPMAWELNYTFYEKQDVTNQPINASCITVFTEDLTQWETELPIFGVC